MQYSKCGHTYILYNVKNCLLLITLKFLYIIPSTVLALSAAATHCLEGLRSLEINTPNNLFLLQLPVVQQPILYHSGSTWSAKCAPHSMPSVHTAMIQLWLGLVLGNCCGYAGVSVRMADRKQHL